MVAEVVVGTVVAVVVAEVMMGTAALLWRTLSDGATVGHIL